MGKVFWTSEKTVFLLLLVSFPGNLAKHFIFPAAYIRGVLVDYLVPTVYLTELLVLLLLVFSLSRSILSHPITFKPFGFRNIIRKGSLFILFPLTLLPSIFSGGFSAPSLFRLVEIVLWSGFVFWVTKNISWRKDRQTLVGLLSLSVVWVSLLAIAQFFIQRNVFGYWFLGEPTLYPSLGGVAHAPFFGREVLRAYSTFPHPNILGGVLAVLLPWLLAEGLPRRVLVSTRLRRVKAGFLISAGLGVVALFVSFSRLAWVVFLLGLLVAVAGKIQDSHRLKFVFPASLILLVVAFSLFPSVVELSVARRVELLQSAKEMFLSSPLVGIGLGLFTAKLPSFGLPLGPTLFLQPVHNVFALVAAESGLLALAALLLVLTLAAYKVLREKRVVLLVSLIQLVLLGFFDHYLYTLPQGLFLISLTLGFIFSYSRDDGR